MVITISLFSENLIRNSPVEPGSEMVLREEREKKIPHQGQNCTKIS